MKYMSDIDDFIHKIDNAVSNKTFNSLENGKYVGRAQRKSKSKQKVVEHLEFDVLDDLIFYMNK